MDEKQDVDQENAFINNGMEYLFSHIVTKQRSLVGYFISNTLNDLVQILCCLDVSNVLLFLNHVYIVLTSNNICSIKYIV